MFNYILPKHKQEQNDTQSMGFFGFDCKPSQTKKKKDLQIDLKCMINQEVLVMKSADIDQSMLDVKIEYSIFVDRKYLDQLQSLSENYNKEEDVVQIIAVCSHGIKIPVVQDFHFFFESYEKLQQSKSIFKTHISNKPQKLIYRLLICAIILNCTRIVDLLIAQITETLNLYTLIKLALITLQYESKEYSCYFYSLLSQYFQFNAGVYSQNITNPHLQKVIMNVAQAQIKLVKEDIIQVQLNKKQLQVGTLFFRSLYKKIENRKKRFFQPLQKYQFFKNQRTKTHLKEESDYPHYFRLQDEAEEKQHLVAYQDSPHGEILIFEKEQIQYIKYADEYVGVIERNFWGTTFQVYDFGYPKEAASKIPRYFGQERKEIVNIQYQTNIMASQPRKFTATMINFVDQTILQLGQMDPVYNEEKECYQLNFFGRAKKASARNFEIIDPNDPNIIYLLHGKWEKNLFNVDYRYPMNMVQAFSFSLSSVSKKFLVQ